MKARRKTFAIRDGIEATTRAVVAADEAYLRDAIESMSWQRRGLLQRLRRVDQRDMDASIARGYGEEACWV
jgi:hypothetical protein